MSVHVSEEQYSVLSVEQYEPGCRTIFYELLAHSILCRASICAARIVPGARGVFQVARGSQHRRLHIPLKRTNRQLLQLSHIDFTIPQGNEGNLVRDEEFHRPFDHLRLRMIGSVVWSNTER